MTPAEAGRRLRLTPAAVKSHDDELAPFRTPTGRRIYTADAVERLAARRDAKERFR